MIPGVVESADNRMEIPVTVPKEIRERVIVGPAGTWVKERAVDESFRHAASYSILLSDRQHHASYNEDYYRVVRRLETRQALQELGQWRLDFDPRTQHVTIHSLTTRRDETVTDHAQADKLRFLQREGGLEAQVIDGWITLVVLLEDIRIGDLLDVSYTVHTSPGFLKDRSWVFTTVPSQVALRAFHLTVRFTSGRAMRWKSNDKEFVPIVSEQEGDTEWTWTRENLQLTEQESHVPPWHFSGTWVQVTDCASWAEIATGISSAWRETLDAPELLRMAEEITASVPTLLDRIDRAVTMVQDDIRYLSVNIDLGGQIPSPPAAVLRRCYGDCKDKSFLLSHLLRLLGVKSWPVLVNTFLRQAVEELLPTPGAFNHAIVKYEIDGQTRWVDATLTLQGGGALARLVPDFRTGLALGPEVKGLEKIPPLPARDERYELRESFSLDSRPGHSSILNVNIRASGWNAENLRRGFATVGEAEMARVREQFYRGLFPDLQRAGALEWADNRDSDEFRLSESYDIKDAAKLNGGGRMCVFYYQAHHIQSILGVAQTGKRKNPYIIPFPCHVEHSIEMETTSNLNDSKVMPPVMEQGGTFRFSRDQKRKGNRAVVTYILRTMTGTVAPQQFETHKKQVNKIWPTTFFNFQFPRGLPAPQRRHVAGTKIAPIVSKKPFQTNAPAQKVVSSAVSAHQSGSGRRRRTKRPQKEIKKSEGPSSWHSVWVVVILILFVAGAWLLWVLSLLKK